MKEEVLKSLENEMRLLAYYNMRNHVGAKALEEDGEHRKFYRLLYSGMKKDIKGFKMPDSLISVWSGK